MILGMPSEENPEMVYEKFGNASLGVMITNGPEIVVRGSGLTIEEACEAVAAYLPVVPRTEIERLKRGVDALGNQDPAERTDT
jgi:hypothetical protein